MSITRDSYVKYLVVQWYSVKNVSFVIQLSALLLFCAVAIHLAIRLVPYADLFRLFIWHSPNITLVSNTLVVRR